MKYIVKFFPEIMIKGDAIKKKMVRRLHENLLRLLKRVDDEIVTQKYWDKIEVLLPVLRPGLVGEVERVLLNTPGVDQVWRVKQYPITDLDSVVEKVVPFALPLVEGKSFAVRARRAGSHEFDSLQIQCEVGRRLLAEGQPLKVDLNNPQAMIEIDVYDNFLNIIEQKMPAMGGYPLGSQGDALSLMSGGFDSTVASYLAIKRGVKTHFVFFNLGGTAHELGVKQVAIHLWHHFSSSHRIQFISVPFDEVVAELFHSVHESYMGVVLKRLMLQAAEQIADEMGIAALITGESVAQVSSQTLKNLAAIDQATNKLILRPLAFMHKTEIMALAQKIGTRQFAETMPEYCGVISKNPVIEASLHRTLKEATRFDQTVLMRAIAAKVVSPVDELVAQIVEASPIETVSQLSGDDILVDIRAEAEQRARPLDNALNVPFYSLSQAAKTWSADKRYLLYCKKGVLSQLHAQYLRDAGYQNVAVYRKG